MKLDHYDHLRHELCNRKIPHILHSRLSKNNGTFVLRIEDTDESRNEPQWTQGIIDALAWIGIDSNDETIIDAMLSMASSLGMYCIAEGVETEAQRQVLLNAGCDYGQGYLFSKPVSASEFASKYLLT